MEAWAIVTAGIALIVSVGQAFLSWLSRNDYARSVLIAKRIEVAAEFQQALDHFEDAIISTIAAINASENSKCEPHFAQQKALAISQYYDRVDLLTSTLALIFDDDVHERAKTLRGKLMEFNRLALDAAQGPNPARHQLKYTYSEIHKLSQEWLQLMRGDLNKTPKVFVQAGRVKKE